MSPSASEGIRVMLTGGGTGGHVTPNMALLPYLAREGWSVVYVGGINGMEKGLIEPLGVPYYGIDSAPLDRYFTLTNLLIPFHVLRGIRQAGKLMKTLKPDVVFSKGGFVSVPVVFAAKRAGIPVVSHESDMTPGLANRLAIPKSRRVCVNFTETLEHLPEGKGVYTGTPIRDELLSGSRERGIEISGLTGGKPILMVMGGSSGAQGLNAAVRKALPELLPEFDVLHLCGKGNADETLAGTKGYFQIEYASEEMPHFYAAADLMMCRAGANSLAEILALAIPNVLVPLPLDASRGDQILNAESFRKKGYSCVLPQEEASPERVLEAAREVYRNRETYRKAMKEAGETSGSKKVIAVLKEAMAEAGR